MNKVIRVRPGKINSEGAQTYIYNFIDLTDCVDQKMVNMEFKSFGRVTNNGVVSKLNPKELNELKNRFGIINSLTVGAELDTAQKAIDKCNSMSGCGSYCSSVRQAQCSKLQLHSHLIDKHTYVREFLQANIVPE